MRVADAGGLWAVQTWVVTLCDCVSRAWSLLSSLEIESRVLYGFISVCVHLLVTSRAHMPGIYMQMHLDPQAHICACVCVALAVRVGLGVCVSAQNQKKY